MMITFNKNLNIRDVGEGWGAWQKEQGSKDPRLTKIGVVTRASTGKLSLNEYKFAVLSKEDSFLKKLTFLFFRIFGWIKTDVKTIAQVLHSHQANVESRTPADVSEASKIAEEKNKELQEEIEDLSHHLERAVKLASEAEEEVRAVEENSQNKEHSTLELRALLKEMQEEIHELKIDQQAQSEYKEKLKALVSKLDSNRKELALENGQLRKELTQTKIRLQWHEITDEFAKIASDEEMQGDSGAMLMDLLEDLIEENLPFKKTGRGQLMLTRPLTEEEKKLVLEYLAESVQDSKSANSTDSK